MKVVSGTAHLHDVMETGKEEGVGFPAPSPEASRVPLCVPAVSLPP